jgi:hypothetical protein
MRARVLAATLLAAASPAAADIPKAIAVLEAPHAPLPDQVPEAMPPRFVLLEDGQVFVGGTHGLVSTKLQPRELKDLEKRLETLRKHPALAGVVTIGPGREVRRLILRKGRPLEAKIEGDLDKPSAGLESLARMLRELSNFNHPGLRPYQPVFFAMSAKEGTLPGGCRRWTRFESLDDAVFAPRLVTAAEFPTWPTGAAPASVCAGDKRYVVTLRPMLPGETP